MRRFPLGASLWSSEFLGLVLMSSVASFGYPCIFYLSLICLLEVLLITLYQFGRCGFIYKVGRKPVSRRMTMTSADNLDDDARLQWCVCGLCLVARVVVCALATVVLHDVVEGVCIGFWPVSR
jgi:hypothetical protein